MDLNNRRLILIVAVMIVTEPARLARRLVRRVRRPRTHHPVDAHRHRGHPCHPAGYRTELQLVTVDELMYGHTIRALRHEWPFYRRDRNWTAVEACDASDRVTVWQRRFNQGPHAATVRRRLSFTVPQAATVNGLRVCGTAVLSATTELGACDTLNGDKIIPLVPRTVSGPVDLDVRYEMGGGLASLDARWRPHGPPPVGDPLPA